MATLDQLFSHLSELPTTDLKKFSLLYDEQATILTPLAEAQGRDSIFKYYQQMRHDLQLKRFSIQDHILSDKTLCVKWDSDIIKAKRPMQVLGVSYATLSKDGLIVSQIDYWNINLRSPWLQFAIQKLF